MIENFVIQNDKTNAVKGAGGSAGQIQYIGKQIEYDKLGTTCLAVVTLFQLCDSVWTIFQNGFMFSLSK